jgi:glycosyltransferase involved in cell wall biosynthesis
MYKPAVSVVIPTYNRAPLLSRALQSVATQKFSKYEVIVADDGSSDDTRKVIENWQPVLGERLRPLWLEHRGVAATRNAGLSASRGEVVAFLDSDDEWLPEHLETGFKQFQDNLGLGMVFTDHFIYSDERIRTKVPVSDSQRSLVRNLIIRNAVLLTSVVFLNRKVFEELGGFNESLHGTEDWEYWVRIAVKYPVRQITEATVIIHQHPNNHSANPSKAEKQLEAACDQISKLDISDYCDEGEVRARAYLDSGQFYAWNDKRMRALNKLIHAGISSPPILLSRDALRVFTRAALPMHTYRSFRRVIWRKFFNRQ